MNEKSFIKHIETLLKKEDFKEMKITFESYNQLQEYKSQKDVSNLLFNK